MSELPKHYDFATQESKWQKFWETEKIFEFKPDDGRPIYSIDTPPPTVSGRMHIGHAFSYAHADMIARYHRMKGENVLYPFGTDDNGLATQLLVEKEKKVRAVSLGREKFVELVLQTLENELRPEYISGFKQIGLSCDFSLYYTTINERCRRISQSAFIDLYKNKRAYRQEAPGMYCPKCRTAISQVECEDRELPSIFNDIVFKVDGRDLIISTTRPELLPACVAVFYHPDDKRYQSLKDQQATVPLFGFTVPILADRRVDMAKGTGIVMCCTFGDQTDMEWQKAYQLPIKVAIGANGKMTELAQGYKDLSIKDARAKIIEDMKVQKLLTKQENIVHAVNVHERCGTEVEFIKSKQWFIKYLDLRDRMLEWGKQLNWQPKHMFNRYENWVKGLQWDWCISRQIYYGIPFPVWYCEKCGEIILPAEKDLPIDPLKDQSSIKKCPACGADKFKPETDVLDTWATSCLTPRIINELAQARGVKKDLIPLNLRPQAHDIITFWLFKTVVRSQMQLQKQPFEDVMISGWVLDPHGKKMSKSKGNVIKPKDVFDKFGVDAYRYWAAGSTPGSDHSYREEEVKVGKRLVTKLWNAGKFCALHLEKYKPQDELAESEPVDRWILNQLRQTIEAAAKGFEIYNYTQALEAIDRFFWRDFTDRYLEFVKYRLYGTDAKSKTAAQQTLYQVFLAILKLYAPIIPFITEDVYQFLYQNTEKAKSLHLTSWPEVEKTQGMPAGESAEFDKILAVVEEIKKFKANNKMSVAKELDDYAVQDAGLKEFIATPGFIAHAEFVRQAMRVKNIK